MASEAWRETVGGMASDNAGSTNFAAKPQNSTQRLRPSAKHRSAIRRLVIRHGGAEDSRVADLEDGVASIPADMIEAVCERSWERHRFIPKPAELHEIAKGLLASTNTDDDLARRNAQRIDAMRGKNIKLMQAGDKCRWNLNPDRPELVTLGYKYRCDRQGGIEAAEFNHSRGAWLWPDGSVAA